MISELPVSLLAHYIQLAVAPVFLLTGVASILSVLASRLARIIDRSRFLHSNASQINGGVTTIQNEQDSLKRRAQLIHWAIGLCTVCLLLICTVVAILFLGSFITLDMSEPIAALFVAAMLCLMMALLNFICEIYLATAHIRSGL